MHISRRNPNFRQKCVSCNFPPKPFRPKNLSRQNTHSCYLLLKCSFPAARRHRLLADTHCAYPRSDGQAELTWMADPLHQTTDTPMRLFRVSSEFMDLWIYSHVSLMSDFWGRSWPPTWFHSPWNRTVLTSQYRRSCGTRIRLPSCIMAYITWEPWYMQRVAGRLVFYDKRTVYSAQYHEWLILSCRSNLNL